MAYIQILELRKLSLPLTYMNLLDLETSFS